MYLDVVPGRRLTFTDAFVEGWRPSGKAFMVGTIEPEDAGPGKTRYRATVRHWSAEDCKQHEAMGSTRLETRARINWSPKAKTL
ncbi:MAG: SRPBCC domain-containing protein [Planctomycetota bacterium]